MKTTLLFCLFLTGCTPQEAFIAEEIVHEASVAENAIEADLFPDEAVEYSRPRVDDRASPCHNNKFKQYSNGRKNKRI